VKEIPAGLKIRSLNWRRHSSAGTMLEARLNGKSIKALVVYDVAGIL
jgi:hypothetical protein